MKPSIGHPSPAIVFFALFVATLVGNWSGMREFAERAVDDAMEWKGRGFRGNGEHTDAYRELAEKFVPPGEKLYYCISADGGSLQPAERSTHLALSWARSPDPVRVGGRDDIGDASAVIASRFMVMDIPGYIRIGDNTSAMLWLRGDTAADAGSNERPTPAPLPWREAAGMVVVCALIAWFSNGVKHNDNSGRSPYWEPLSANILLRVCAVAFFILASASALTHTFVAPTGLGVYGGKAKLLYLSGGIPGRFFTDPAFSSYQPAYPPGFALLTLVSYWVSGGCGEWLTQLVPVFAMATIFWLTAEGGRKSCWMTLWIPAAFISKQALQMTAFYYAEPLMALLALLGWMRLRKNRDDWSGWLLLGASGLFKNEGVILLFAEWTAFVVCTRFDMRGRTRCSVYASMAARLFLAATPPLAWHVACRMAGATFYDFAPVWELNLAKFSTALTHLLKLTFGEPWRYGFAYPVAVVAIAAHWIRRRADAKGSCPPVEWLVSVFAASLCLVGFTFVYSLSRAPSFAWHLETSAARLLWTPSLLLLAEFIRIPAPADPGPDQSPAFG